MLQTIMNDLQTNFITLGVYCLEKLARAYFCCRRVCRPAPGLHMQLTQHVSTRRLQPGDDVPWTIVLETWTNVNFKKSRVLYTGDQIPEKPQCPTASTKNPPWVWFGFKTLTDDMVDLTQEMSEFVVDGNLISPDFVQTMFPESRFGTILYVDSKSFETVRLSSSGLVIGDEITAPPPSCGTSVSDSGEVRPDAETS